MLDNQLKKPAHIRESALAFVVMLALTYALYSNFYSPRKEKVTVLKDQLAALSEQRQGLEKLIQTLKQKYQEQNVEMTRQVQIAASRDPKVQLLKNARESAFKNISDLLNAIAKSDFAAKVIVNSMQHDVSRAKKGFQETAFALNVTGRFANVIEFIEKLEDMPALITLEKIDIEVSKKDASQVTLDLNGVFYQVGGENG